MGRATERPSAPPDWYAEVFLAAVALAGFVSLVVVHAFDVRRDLAQEAIRRDDVARYAADPALHGTSEVVQAFGMAWFLALLSVVLVTALWMRGRRSRAGTLAVATLTALLTVTVIKLTVRHPVVQQVFGLHVGSFPSGHTADVTAIGGVALVVLVPLRWRLAAYAVAIGGGLLVADTRVISGAHTPDDVLAGWLLGTALALGAGAWLTSRERTPQVHPEQRVAQVGDHAGR